MSFDEWDTIDPTSDTIGAIKGINTYLELGVGGLSSERLGIALTQVSSNDTPAQIISSASCYDPNNINTL
jgi:hypothetical protein